MGIRIGICGTGLFADHFIPLFKAHPDVENVVLCDLDAEKLEAKCHEFGIPDRSPSLDDLCERDVDAIAIFTQHHLHGPQAVQALRAGKHVWAATRYLAPGLIAHSSAMNGSILLEVPDYGDPV